MPSTTAHSSPRARTRVHKGNTPSLPQTKRCYLCPAKFTRTTHLDRHLRSHANERPHRCSLCKKAEFTRSDLLTRHKRTCGQNAKRSRRKSCEACAESKIKCNQQQPCAKCTFRGRECVFLNDPEASRNRERSLNSEGGGSRRRTVSLVPPDSDARASASAMGPSLLPQQHRPEGSRPISSSALFHERSSDPGASQSSIQISPLSHSKDYHTLSLDMLRSLEAFEDMSPWPLDEPLFSCARASPGLGFLEVANSALALDLIGEGCSPASAAVLPTDQNPHLFWRDPPVPLRGGCSWASPF
ncbi:hypothetical protein GGX14DRAFT_457636 [Mycena pura]|uniref:C6 transcription factor n=1 Tax=Mycena pura TaxID=153505 RepID=A0AAD6VBA0_9AGAR|nr:hypothetical protein GGX14DRAFT_457636 [Mycena pura]